MKKRFAVLLIGILAILSYTAAAQTGAISGIITDSLQNPIEYARISVSGMTNASITDSNGAYLIEDLAPGSYDISVNQSEFHAIIMADVAVEQGSTTELNIELSPSHFAALAASYSYYPGSSVWIPISISNYIPISEINFLLKWPADYLTILSVNPGNRIGYGNFEYYIDDAGPGTIRIHWDAGSNVPMPGGIGAEIWMEVQPDTSLNFGDFVPIWFGGSQSDNAIYDSMGQVITFDDYFSNSIFISSDEPWLAYNPNANNWIVDIGDIAIVADRLIMGYIVWSRNGTGDDAIQETGADLNGNGFVDIADLFRFIYLAQGSQTFGNYPLLKFLSDVDPGERDLFLIGNLDGSPVVGYPGQTVEIPIYAKIDEDLRGIALRIMSDETLITECLGAEASSVLNGW